MREGGPGKDRLGDAAAEGEREVVGEVAAGADPAVLDDRVDADGGGSGVDADQVRDVELVLHVGGPVADDEFADDAALEPVVHAGQALQQLPGRDRCVRAADDDVHGGFEVAGQQLLLGHPAGVVVGPAGEDVDRLRLAGRQVRDHERDHGVLDAAVIVADLDVGLGRQDQACGTDRDVVSHVALLEDHREGDGVVVGGDAGLLDDGQAGDQRHVRDRAGRVGRNVGEAAGVAFLVLDLEGEVVGRLGLQADHGEVLGSAAGLRGEEVGGEGGGGPVGLGDRGGRVADLVAGRGAVPAVVAASGPGKVGAEGLRAGGRESRDSGRGDGVRRQRGDARRRWTGRTSWVLSSATLHGEVVGRAGRQAGDQQALHLARCLGREGLRHDGRGGEIAGIDGGGAHADVVGRSPCRSCHHRRWRSSGAAIAGTAR